MPQPIIVALSLTAAGICLVALIRALRRERDWNVTSTYIFAMSVLLIWTTVLGSATGAATYTSDFFYNRVAVSAPWLDRLREVTSFVIVLVSALFVARGVKRGIPLNLAAVFLMGVIVFGQLATEMSGGTMFSPRNLALVALVAAAAFADRGRSAMLGIGAFGAVVLIVSLAMPSFAYDASVTECYDKCGALGFVFAGALVNGNALGLVLTLALPAIYLAFSGVPRWILVCAVVVVVAASASRTSLNAVLLLVPVLLIARPSYDLDRMSVFRRWAIYISAIAATAASVVVPFVTTDPSAYTGRGALWQLTVEEMRGSEWFGLGSQAWGELTQTGDIAQTAGYSTHNQWFDVWFIAGWVGVALFVLFILAVLMGAGRLAYIPALVAVPAAVIAITERPWAVGTIDTFTFSLFAFMLAAPALARVERKNRGAEAMRASGHLRG